MKTTFAKKLRNLGQSKIFVAAVLMVIGVVLMQRSFAAADATLTLSPNSGSYANGSQFTVTVNENSNSDPVNVVQADLSYDQSKLQFISIDASESAFENSVVSSGGGGSVSIARYKAPGASVTGSRQVAKVTFKAITGTGSTAITFASSSQIASASTNQQIWNGSPTGGTYTLTTPATTPPPSTPTNNTNSGSSTPTTPKPSTSSSPSTSSPAPSASSSTPVPNGQVSPDVTADQAATNEGRLVTVRVTNASGGVVMGAQVKLGNQTATTDATGIASFIGVKPGAHTVTVSSASGKATKKITVTASAETAAVQQFDLPVKKQAPLAQIAVVVLAIAAVAIAGWLGYRRFKNRPPRSSGGSGPANRVVINGVEKGTDPEPVIPTVQPNEVKPVVIDSSEAAKVDFDKPDVKDTDTLETIEKKVKAKKSPAVADSNEFSPTLITPKDPKVTKE